MISVDTLADNKAFAEKEHADFAMLADPDKKVATAYGVINPEAPPDRQFARRWNASPHTCSGKARTSPLFIYPAGERKRRALTTSF